VTDGGRKFAAELLWKDDEFQETRNGKRKFESGPRNSIDETWITALRQGMIQSSHP
jgi:hypothetical protein